MPSYHPQANGLVESFNKILENALQKLCMNNKNGWDDKVHDLLWEYRINYKKGT